MDTPSPTLGQLLSKWMLARGWSANRLAHDVGIAQTTISRWLRDKHLPGADELTRVLDALGVEPVERSLAFSHVDARRSLAHERAGVSSALGDGVLMPACCDLWRALRQRCGRTEREVAEMLGVSVPTVSRWESGASRVPRDHAVRLCELLGAYPEERAWLCDGHVFLPDPLSGQDRSAEAYEERLRTIGAMYDAWTDGPLDLIMLSVIGSMCETARHDASVRHVLVDGLALYAGYLADHLRPSAAIVRGRAAWTLVRDIHASRNRWLFANWAYAHSLAASGSLREAASMRSCAVPRRATTAGDALVLLDLGRYHVELGERTAGLVYLRLAGEVYAKVGDDGGVHNARWQMGCAHIEERRWREALAVLPEPDGQSPNLGFHCHIAWFDALLGAGDRAGAANHLRACEALIARHPGLECHRPTLDVAWRKLSDT